MRLHLALLLGAPLVLSCLLAPRAMADGPLLPGFESGSGESAPEGPAETVPPTETTERSPLALPDPPAPRAIEPEPAALQGVEAPTSEPQRVAPPAVRDEPPVVVPRTEAPRSLRPRPMAAPQQSTPRILPGQQRGAGGAPLPGQREPAPYGRASGNPGRNTSAPQQAPGAPAASDLRRQPSRATAEQLRLQQMRLEQMRLEQMRARQYYSRQQQGGQAGGPAPQQRTGAPASRMPWGQQAQPRTSPQAQPRTQIQRSPSVQQSPPGGQTPSARYRPQPRPTTVRARQAAQPSPAHPWDANR